MTRIVLGSGSPSRLDLLRRAGLDPVVPPGGAAEIPRPGETPPHLTERLAHATATAVAATVDDAPVIGGDPVPEFDGVTDGKPHKPDLTLDMWRRVSGRAAVLPAYVATSEPLRVADAATINGRGGWFVDHVAGHPSNWEGLSPPVLRRLLRRLDVHTVRLWT
ncbi:Maf family protein [Micromonospora sp. RP3T]|uniref:Maf family protein n=1 Tax=Micromonospora sp. RP3T TaxID=2135446 RepID=UPI000D158C8D|nr:Maf family protein [Micromonospora sp. RP3T]PTA47511.1 septum formation inhibitor Maf [Micromonospora sp. RP3T]